MWVVFSTFFGLGYAPGAPGTVGTLGAVGVVYLLSFFTDGISYFVFTLGLTLISFVVAGRCASVLGKKDPPEVVIDEVCGFFVCMLFVTPDSLNLALGFFIFRFFDIAKPFPIRRAEGLPGGYGIVMDDVLAGVYANLCLQVLVRLY
ncbi:MAG: phosphatidylglycerophosphatase A [Candidatus Dadabacteria bacterium]|nr:phosphatidylglycerophosphatase A [Candidatus Dadabacteria bacterium]